MKYITALFAVSCFFSHLYSQDKDAANIYREVLESQIDFENKDNKFSTMNVVFIDKRFSDIKLSYDGVSLNNLNKKELKAKSKKGIDIIEIYPIKVSNNKIEIETSSIFRKRKKITIYGKSTYYFEYDCEKKEYTLTNKNQKML